MTETPPMYTIDQIADEIIKAMQWFEDEKKFDEKDKKFSYMQVANAYFEEGKKMKYTPKQICLKINEKLNKIYF